MYERDRDQRPERAGREAGEPAAEAECQAVAPVAEHSPVDGRVEHRAARRPRPSCVTLGRRGAATPGWPERNDSSPSRKPDRSASDSSPMTPSWK